MDCAHERLRRIKRECGRMGAVSAWRRCRRARLGCNARGGVRAGGAGADAVITESDVQPLLAIEVECAAPDLELLFVDWLNTVIYEMAVREMLFRRFLVRIDGVRLAATLWGEPVDVERHAPACEPKGATYTALKVFEDSDRRWSAACVVDV